MNDLLPIPTRADLRALPVRHKREAVGIAWCVFAALRLLRWCGSTWARRVHDDFVQVISGVIYWHDARPSVSLQGHEAVHDWQQRRFGVVRYVWRYYTSRARRQHYEAQAYGYEVAVHGRLLEERARTAADEVYKMGWSVIDAGVMIDQYAARFRANWGLR